MKKWFSIAIPVLLLALLIGWRITEKRSESMAESSQRNSRSKKTATVSVVPVQFRDITQTLDVTGSVEAPLDVKIAPKITGRIESLSVKEGDYVHKGQVLVRIDPSEVDADVRQQRAAVAEAQYRLAQAKMTQNATTVGVNTQVRQQKAGVTSANADYNQAKKNYDAQVASAEAAVADAQSRVESADASVSNSEAQVASAQANLENARAKYDRTLNLYKQGFIAAQDVDDAKASLKVQESALEVAKGQLRSATASKDSALSQKHAADQQAHATKAKGEADVESAHARLIQAKASAEYAVSNTSQASAYRQSIAALQAGVDAAKASLKSAEARRADTVLVSPLDGYVTGRYMDPGSVISSGQAALSVQFMHQVWVTLAVPEEAIPSLHIGQTGNVQMDAFPGKTFSGSIIQINPSADSQSRQFQVRVILDNSKKMFHPGMFAKVSLITQKITHAMVVPREAVQKDKSGQYVMVAGKDNRAEKRPVVTGISDSDYTVITGGLQDGEKVVSLTALPLKDGQSIRAGGKHKRGGKK